MMTVPVAQWDGSDVELAPGEQRELTYRPQQPMYFNRVLFVTPPIDGFRTLRVLGIRAWLEVWRGDVQGRDSYDVPCIPVDAVSNGDRASVQAVIDYPLHAGMVLAVRVENPGTEPIRFSAALLMRLP